MANRILLATDELTRATVGQGLTREGFEVVVAVDGADAITRLTTEPPAMVILDAASPQFNGEQLLQSMTATDSPAARVPVILLTEHTDIEARVRALRLGADDCIPKPVHPIELAARVRGLLARLGIEATAAASAVVDIAPAVVPTMRTGAVHAYYGAKGGVGTTTLALNAAVCLRRATDQSVVLVDGNLQFGDHRVFLSLGMVTQSLADIAGSGEIDAEVVAPLLVRHGSGIHLLLSPPAPEYAELVSSERHDLLRAVEVLRTMYDYVVVDLDRRLDDHALDIISVADPLFVVMNADVASIKNVSLAFETLAQLGLAEDRVRLVLNRANAVTGINAKAIETVLRRPVGHQIMNDYRVALSSLNRGAIVSIARPKSMISKGIAELVRSVTDGGDTQDKQEPESAPLARVSFKQALAPVKSALR